VDTARSTALTVSSVPSERTGCLQQIDCSVRDGIVRDDAERDGGETFCVPLCLGIGMLDAREEAHTGSMQCACLIVP
jgi:hypothetical protein